ncbi:MAG: ribbon-helix-helix domain-containing protein [Candidatus Heimdallarchaeota archaeon]|nr:ribbon-helix-helix domain-containing protein [Candidatus Heimdallarchaeota archaeon]
MDQEEGMILTSIKITKEQLAGLDELLRRERYPSRSEAIRAAIRDLIKQTKGRY